MRKEIQFSLIVPRENPDWLCVMKLVRHDNQVLEYKDNRIIFFVIGLIVFVGSIALFFVPTITLPWWGKLIPVALGLIFMAIGGSTNIQFDKTAGTLVIRHKMALGSWHSTRYELNTITKIVVHTTISREANARGERQIEYASHVQCVRTDGSMISLYRGITASSIIQINKQTPTHAFAKDVAAFLSVPCKEEVDDRASRTIGALHL